MPSIVLRLSKNQATKRIAIELALVFSIPWLKARDFHIMSDFPLIAPALGSPLGTLHPFAADLLVRSPSIRVGHQQEGDVGLPFRSPVGHRESPISLSAPLLGTERDGSAVRRQVGPRGGGEEAGPLPLVEEEEGHICPFTPSIAI